MAKRDDVREAFAALLEILISNPQLLTDETMQMMTEMMTEITAFLEQEEPEPTTPILDESIRLVWYLAGGDPQTFLSYLNSFPDPQLNNLLNSPERLESTIEQLSQQPLALPEMSSDGIQESGIKSSNVFGFRYDPDSRKLRVKFNGKDVKSTGPMYEYENIPPQIAEMFMSGAVPAKTKGRNRWGRWWRGKSPSIGAAANRLLRNGGFNYRRLS